MILSLNLALGVKSDGAVQQLGVQRRSAGQLCIYIWAQV